MSCRQYVSDLGPANRYNTAARPAVSNQAACRTAFYDSKYSSDSGVQSFYAQSAPTQLQMVAAAMSAAATQPQVVLEQQQHQCQQQLQQLQLQSPLWPVQWQRQQQQQLPVQQPCGGQASNWHPGSRHRYRLLPRCHRSKFASARCLPQQQQQWRWQQQQQEHHGPRCSSVACKAAGSSAAYGDSSSDGSSGGSSSIGGITAAANFISGLQETGKDLQDLLLRFLSLWRKFLPMLSLFFCLSFINTILDSLKDTLVITARGGGAFVIPYLTVYAVLPVSVLFLVLFSAASHKMSRSALFTTIIVVFMAFFGGFALFLYPNADVLHPHALADSLQQTLPQGLAGAVGMFRNWTFTLFFCMSELWGDVCMGLLFWGLANEITSLSDAATLYPLFGLGANLAQAIAGVVLKATTAVGAHEFGRALQLSMAAVIGIAGFAVFLQQHITTKAELAAGAHQLVYDTASSAASSSNSVIAAASPAAAKPPKPKQEKPQPNVMDSFRILANSLEIRCLAVMSLAQGLCNSLMEFAWKCHMRILYPSPADFTAFLGDVATWSGVVTGSLMLLSPLLFERWGWQGVANATPNILLYGGSIFFLSCIAYQYLFGAAVAAGGAAAAGAVSLSLLKVLVGFGALLYVFGKGAKFSLFKPAEEMVYITLDEEARTRGKAAIDVVGAQTGKSGGSLLQQALLLASAGSITGIMPAMFGVFFLMLRGWRSAVHSLSQVRHYSYDSPMSSTEDNSNLFDPAAAAAFDNVAAVGGKTVSSSSSKNDSNGAASSSSSATSSSVVAVSHGAAAQFAATSAADAAASRQSSVGLEGLTGYNSSSSDNGTGGSSSSGAGSGSSDPSADFAVPKQH